VLEADRDRTRPEGCRVVGPAGLAVVGIGIGAEPEMPLADAGCRVAVGVQESGQGQPPRFDQRRRAPAEDAALQPGSPRVAAGQERVAGGSADRRWTVGIGEPDAFAGQTVEVGSRYSGLRVVGAEVAVAEVVGEDQQDVRPLGPRPFAGLRRGCAAGNQERRGCREPGGNAARARVAK